MNRDRKWAIGLGLLALCGAAALADDPEPLDLGTKEETTVRLILLDVVAVDRQGRTVSDLTLDDFELQDGGTLTPIDTLDVDCPAGGVEDPRGVRKLSARSAPADGDQPRRLVMLLDYLHLDQRSREFVFNEAIEFIREGTIGSDEIMLAALTGGLRIEQRFTNDRETLLGSINRMRNDITLWGGNYSHLTEDGWVAGITALLDVLQAVPGRKSILLYSLMGDTPLDREFEKIAAQAAVSRCSFYPVYAQGLHSGPIRDVKSSFQSTEWITPG